MPASYRIDAAAGVVFVTLQGRVTDQDMLEGQRQLAGDPAFRPAMSQCVDARGVTDLSITAAGVRELARGSIFAPGSRRAIIAESAVTFGYSRMFQILRETAGDVIRVFRAAEDAHRWLGLPWQPGPLDPPR
jgi:hypothetical protein